MLVNGLKVLDWIGVNVTSIHIAEYPTGSRTIPARSESAGMQDGIDLINALATHPETGRRLARKFWSFFISDVHPPDPAFVEGAAAVYRQSGTEIRPVVSYILNRIWTFRSRERRISEWILTNISRSSWRRS